MSSREIKFRVWDIEAGEYGDPSLLEVFNTDGILGHLYDPNKEKTVIQQYTGLKDKNGKDIYEGDILKETHYEYTGKFTDLFRDPKKMEGYPYRGVVSWTEGCPCNTNDSTDAYALLGFRTFPLDTTVGQVTGNAITRDCEIVGNMYENPKMMIHGPYGPTYTK